VITALEPLRRSARVVTKVVSADLVRVSTPDRVLGHVRTEPGGFTALRGPDVRAADVLGRYPSQGMALEALRQRRR
jgi:hypothetical protein